MGVSLRYYKRNSNGKVTCFSREDDQACIAHLTYKIENVVTADYVLVGPPISRSIYDEPFKNLYEDSAIVRQYIQILKASSFNQGSNTYFRHKMYKSNPCAKLISSIMTYTEMLLCTSLVRYLWEYGSLSTNIVKLYKQSQFIKDTTERADFAIFGGHIYNNGLRYSNGHSVVGADLPMNGILNQIPQCIAKCKDQSLFLQDSQYYTNLNYSFTMNGEEYEGNVYDTIAIYGYLKGEDYDLY